jgi:hypothetical protein
MKIVNPNDAMQLSLPYFVFFFFFSPDFFPESFAPFPGSYDPNSLHKSRVPLDIFPERQTIGHLTVALDPLLENSHTKHPNLIIYASCLGTDTLRRQVSRILPVPVRAHRDKP